MVAPPQHITVAAAVHRIQQALLDAPSTPHTILLAAAPLLSRQDFDDVVMERNILLLCGDPRCSTPLPSSRSHRGRYHISLREHRVYDLTESARYCSEACLVSSRAFAAGLQEDRGSDMIQATVQRVLDLLETGREVGVKGDSGCRAELGFSELRITEKDVAGDGDVRLDEWIGPSDAIDGYVPQHDYGLNQGGLFDVEDSWHDTPPEGFSLSLSSFATIWMVLFEWITRASLAYVYGCEASSQDEFSVVNGREYPPKVVLADGKSSEIRRTVEDCIGRVIPRFISENNLRKPVSTIEKAVGMLLDTMTFMDAVPPFRTFQWHIIILLFVDALSMHRIPFLASNVTENRTLLNKVLNTAQISGEEYQSLRDIILPLGIEPIAGQIRD